MKISVCVPSYRRPRVKTSEYLPFVKIYIDKSDEDEYRKYNPDYNLVVCRDGVQGNLARVRNYILDEVFGDGADAVILMDDDVSGIYRFEVQSNGFGYKSIHVDADEFLMYMEKYIILTKDWGIGAFSLNNTNMPMSYQHFKPFLTHALNLGCFTCHVQNKLRYDENLPLKEDYDMFIQQQNEYRGMLSIRSMYYVADIGVGVGGTAVRRNYEREREQQDLLIKKWGSRIVKRKKDFKTNYKSLSQDIHIPIQGI